MSNIVEEDIWPTNHKKYKLRKIIGTGATATVYEAYCKPRKEKCAIKCIDIISLNNRVKAVREIETMKACNHENILTYYTSFQENKEHWLVMSLSEGGSLLDKIKSKMTIDDCRHGVFDEMTIATVLKEILKALEYLHNEGLIHRDVKADNILINKDGRVQIGDLGCCTWLPTNGDHSELNVLKDFAGTYKWMAPEIKKKNGYDFKADVWSFGITAIEMVTGTTPHEYYRQVRINTNTLLNESPSLEAACIEDSKFYKYGNSIRKMIADCLQEDPARRPTASDLLKHPFFMNAKDKTFVVKNVLMPYS